jgi:hypothetical protein
MIPEQSVLGLDPAAGRFWTEISAGKACHFNTNKKE